MELQRKGGERRAKMDEDVRMKIVGEKKGVRVEIRGKEWMKM